MTAQPLALPKLLQHGLSDGRWLPICGFRARTKLVDEDQRAVVGLADHPLHAQQVGGVGAQVVLQALLVADVHHDVVEEARLGTIAHGDGEAHLEHVLEQADRLQTHRLAACVGSGDDQDAALARQRDLQGMMRCGLLSRGSSSSSVEGRVSASARSSSG